MSQQGWRRWWPLCKIVLLGIVLAAVVWQGWKLTRGLDLRAVRLRPLWLLPAIAAYLAGWLPAIWYWRKIMRELGDDVGWLPAMRAYFCGHLGKYIPGKAGVVFIRASLVQPHGARFATAAVTAGFETLCTMAAGGIVAAALAPWSISTATREAWFAGWPAFAAHPLFLPLAVILASLLGLPVLSRVLNLILKKFLPPALAADGPPPILRPSFSAMLILALGWGLHGLSLGFTIRALSPGPMNLADWPQWTAAAAAGTVLGFAALFAPGGAGIRELVLMEILRPTLGGTAVLAAALLRIVWLIGEVGAAAGLYYALPDGRRGDPQTTGLPATPTSERPLAP